MAVDTREKRMSMLNFAEGSYAHVGFEADAAVDLDDRQHLLDCYSGIAFSAAVTVERERNALVFALIPDLLRGDVVRLRAVRTSGSATIRLVADGSSLFIEGPGPPA